jgi:hypothetical protein
LHSTDHGQYVGRARAKVPEEVAPQVVRLTQPGDEEVSSVPGVVALVEIGDRTPHHARREQDPGVVPAWPQQRRPEDHWVPFLLGAVGQVLTETSPWTGGTPRP